MLLLTQPSSDGNLTLTGHDKNWQAGINSRKSANVCHGLKSTMRSAIVPVRPDGEALTLAFCSCSSALVLTAGICRRAVRVGGYPHLVRCGGRRRRAEFSSVEVEDALQDGENIDIDGIGVDGEQRLKLRSEDLDFEVALRSHRREIRVGSANCRRK